MRRGAVVAALVASGAAASVASAAAWGNQFPVMAATVAARDLTNGYDRPASSRKAWTASNSMRRFFSMMIVWVPSGSIT